jgi:uncharacterized protein (TIGR04255 family)
MAKDLKKKPLVEAIMEIRWKLQGASPGPQTDPHYKLMLGRLFDRMLQDYPEHQELPTATVPDELVGYVVQHRFRVAPNSWPLVQIGPGVFTVNSAADYKWSDFQPRVLSAVEKFYDAHPKIGDLKITNLVLRYIDAVDFDYRTSNMFDFLRDKLKLGLSLPGNLFDGTCVESRPNTLTWQCSFKCERPRGIISVRFATGQKSNAPVLVWETTVESAGDDLPEVPRAFDRWLNAAHDITDDWFFKMIEGDLERRFSDG